MAKLRSIKGIGEINEWGEVIDKYPYEGEKGFKIVELKNCKVLYSLDEQKKLFDLPKNVPIESNHKAIVVPIKHIKYVLGKNEKLHIDDNLLGVFNTSGELLNLCKKVKLENKFFQATDELKLDCLWGLYTYDGKEIFPKEYLRIFCIKCKIQDKKETLFNVVSNISSMGALFDSNKNVIIPFGFYSISVLTGNIVSLFHDPPKGNEQYLLKLNENGNIIAEKIK